jgi:hypothetical protein
LAGLLAFWTAAAAAAAADTAAGEVDDEAEVAVSLRGSVGNELADADERTQRAGCNCDRSDEVLSARRDRLDGVAGVSWEADGGEEEE